MKIHEDFGDGFVSIATSPTSEDEIHALLRTHRAVQMPCGNIILKEPDGSLFNVMLEETDAEAYNIERIGVDPDLTVIYPNQDAPPEENRVMMIFVKRFILDLSTKMADVGRN